MKLFRIWGATAIVAVSYAGVATAESLGAHEHGVGQLNIAFEDNEVEMELTAPGADIVGFEHKPSDAADETAVAIAVRLLNDPAAIFDLPAKAACALEEVEVESGLILTDASEAKEDDHGHEEHAHGDEHGEKDEDHAHGDEHGEKDEDHAHGDEHGKKDDDHAHGEEHGHDDDHAAGHSDDGEAHAEFSVHYHFECENMAALDTIGLTYFKSFPRAQKLNVQALLVSGQAAATLTPDQDRFALSQ